MPLLKRKPFELSELPNDLEPDELVYQIRFSKEIFRDYPAYLNRINLYRQRLWSCKFTGKANLTYEEAMVSEKRATEKVQELPKELLAPALLIIQFSMLSLKDLADTIATKLQDCLFVGAELLGRKDGGLFFCKILKAVEGGDKARYEVAWLDRYKKVVENTIANREDLVCRKLPFSRQVLKSFIRESTYRSSPWVLHDKLAQKHEISTNPPEELRSKVFVQDGLIVCHKKRRKTEDDENNSGLIADDYEGDRSKENSIKYPIDDMLVKPGSDDPVFTDRPHPTKDFKVSMDCVGDLLLVWDFCSSFGKLLQLWRFSLENFENALCHKDSNLALIMELHSAFLRLLIKDSGQYLSAVENKGRKLKITLINWTEYLCDFLEMGNAPELCTHVTPIKRGRYGLLDAQAKLAILQELINHALETDIFKEKMGEYIEERQALGATRRGEALEEARKKREEKERLKAQSVVNGVIGEHTSENGSNLEVVVKDDHIKRNGELVNETNGEIISSQDNHTSGKSNERHNLKTGSKKMAKQQIMRLKARARDAEDPSGEDSPKQLKNDNNGATYRKSKEQRKEMYEREMQKRYIRTNPLGKDRNYTRYWWFRRDGRIFVETSDFKQWGYYNTKEELDALIGSLNLKGERERALKKQLETYYGKICTELQKQSKDFTGKIAMEEEEVVRRSTRVRVPPGENPANAFLRYINKWKED
ncbi:DDT domain-containing protein [Tripterygium wilfordii]|uniref:DDT domain-containing protein n=1 Tax=Tripterygium wilfordii TaxID=458696 RepID=A0A7J7DFK3_TRIWF|nr:DDT domain-containing protein DDB_G0282237-like [Tripterygium wilfordii]XP_038707045.1 DDT domain-containing protein DDB_G0282237-like [Tripterygium wilfordii]KAF5745091.1 DDT domain-containing protein [Tripterygium wilfordii]